MLKLLNALISFILLAWMSSVRCDYYTSVVGLENLLDLESMWLENIENYANTLEKSHELIRKHLDNFDRAQKKFNEKTVPFYEDPLGSFQTIKRVTSDWKVLESFVLRTKESDEYAKNLTRIQAEYSFIMPSDDDLRGAAIGMARLQRTYDLKTEDVANGKLLATESRAKMTAHDCFHLGHTLFVAQDYHHAIEWLIEARTRIQNPNNANDLEFFLNVHDENILEFLSPAFFNIGNYKMAVKINEELLFINPNNAYGLNNKPLFRAQLDEDHDLVLPSNFSITIPNNQTELEHRVEAVCRGEMRQTLAETRNLRCSYVSNNVPFCLLAPFKLEELSLEPAIVYYHESIYESEIDKILEHSVMNLERSEIGKYEVKHASEMLISKGSWLLYENHRFMDALAQRLADMTGLSLKSAEALRVANYGIGGHFGPHHDCRDYSSSELGNRIATAMFYINNVELGGATVFPILRLVVPPVRRSLVLWYNMHESSEFDYRTIHAGCPVLKGSKWICNEWFHEEEQEFKRPCSLRKQGRKSIEHKDFIDWHFYDRILAETKE